MLRNNQFHLYLIRHGQTAINAEGKIIGQPIDIKLTELGIWQAKQLRKRFKCITPDTVFSSTYTRAQETANLAFPHSNILLSEELREYSPGDWRGKDRKETITADIKLKMKTMGNTFLPPNGESLSQVGRRTSKWLEDEILYNETRSSLSEDNPLNIFVVSHGLAIKTIIHYIMGFQQHFTWSIDIDNTSVSKFFFSSTDGWKLNYLNDTSHLIK